MRDFYKMPEGDEDDTDLTGSGNSDPDKEEK